MKDLSCIFTDLDGTLLNTSHKIMPKTLQLLRDLYQKGVIITPVSARMPATITPITDVIDTNLPIITYNGAYALDSDGSPIISFSIDENTSADIYAYTKKNYPDVCICVYYKNEWVVDDISDSRIQAEIQAVGVAPSEIPILKYIKTVKNLHKLFVVGEPTRTDKLLNEINNRWKTVYACKSRDIFIEITSRKASKGNAVRQFAEKKNLDLRRSVAFGDQINDIDMIKVAGAGVAMENAVPEVKSAADFITAANDNEGIYEFLNLYLNT